jgi:hypothetical protein
LGVPISKYHKKMPLRGAHFKMYLSKFTARCPFDSSMPVC